MNNEKNSGFTLIELLAVIVILAIITLIATPIILNIIKDSKEESNKRSIEMYAKAIENSIIKYQMLSNQKINGAFLSTEDGRLLTQEGRDPLVIEYDGSKIFCSLVEIYDDGNIFLGNCIINEDETKSYNYGNKRYSNGEVVYFDVKEGTGCSESDYKEDNSNTGYNGYTNKDENNDEKEKLDIQNSCLKFYAFNDDGSKKINLLLDHNTTSTAFWATYANGSGPTSSGNNRVINHLKTDTDGWNGTITPKNYEYKGEVKPYYIVKYDTEEYKYKARLITANEIARITGADKALNWKEEYSASFYYLDGAKGTNPEWTTQVVGQYKAIKTSEYYWLYDRTSQNCKDNGCLNNSNLSTYGYWTSSASAKSSSGAWAISAQGIVTSYRVDLNYSYGVRPVIEVLKEKLY